jgi:hypothetical protein
MSQVLGEIERKDERRFQAPTTVFRSILFGGSVGGQEMGVSVVQRIEQQYQVGKSGITDRRTDKWGHSRSQEPCLTKDS